MKVNKETGVVLYRSGGYLDGKWGKWVVGTYSDSDYCVPGCLDFSTDEQQEFDTLEEAVEVFTRLAKATQ